MADSWRGTPSGGTSGNSPGTAPPPSGYVWNGYAYVKANPDGSAPTTPVSFRGTPGDGTGSGGGGGASTPSAPSDGGIFGKPGAGEDYYSSHKDAFDKPTQAGDYWKGVQGAFQGGPVAPTNTRDAWGTASGWFSGPHQGVQGAYDAADYLKSYGPGEMNAYGTMGYFNSPGAGEQHVRDSMGFFGQPGAAETNYGDAKSALSGINFGGRAITDATGTANQARNAVENYGKIANYGSTPNDIQKEYGYFLPGLRGKSYSEQLYDEGNSGLNSFYSRARDQGTRHINDQLSAMGLFGSGANIRGIEELNADLGAQQARDMASLAQQADQERLGRTAGALAFTQAGSAEDRARKALVSEAAGRADTSLLEGGKLRQGAYTLGSNEALGKVRAGTEAADTAQRNALDRMFKGGSLALEGDKAGLERTKAGVDAGLRADELGLRRATEGADIGLRADQTQGGLYRDFLSGAKTADDSERTSINDHIDNLVKGGGLASSADAAEFQRLVGGMNAATAAQTLLQNRNKLSFDMQLQLADHMAQTLLGSTDAGAKDLISLGVTGIEARLKQAGLKAEEAHQSAQELFSLLSLAQQGAKTYKTGGI